VAGLAVILIAGHARLDDLRGAIRGRWLPARAVAWLVFLPGVAALRAWPRPGPRAPRPIAVRGPDPVPLVASYPRVAPGTAPTAGG
jgi:hypothetical protein